ncbi:MAG: hypothetical protein K2P99_01850 [Burkholderiales bacterium]|nr:hypothetical protein [Burkholderiales bacterium]
MKKLNIIVVSIIISSSVFATQNPATVQQIKPQASSDITSNINSVDKSVSDIYELKRKVEIAKQEAEIQRIKSGGTSGSGSGINENSQTTVTGVAIDVYGKKIAWLKFADGGELTVNVGSKVGKYNVANITMSGVTLKNKTNRIFLKRVYMSETYAQRSSKPQPQNYLPSPVVTSANGSETMVPPIVTN